MKKLPQNATSAAAFSLFWSASGVIIVLTVGTLGVVEIVLQAAGGAGTLGKFIFLFGGLAEVEFQLTALRTAENAHGKRSGDEVWQVAEDPAGFSELDFFIADMAHENAAVRAGGDLFHMCSFR